MWIQVQNNHKVIHIKMSLWIWKLQNRFNIMRLKTIQKNPLYLNYIIALIRKN